MGKRSSPGSQAAPGDAELADRLGPVKRHWDALLAAAADLAPKARTEWKFYKSLGASGGWRCVIRDGTRNLAYLRPDTGAFLVSFALSAAEIDAAERAGLAAELVQTIRQGPKLPEGHAARIEVRSHATLKAAVALLRAKSSR